MNLPEYRKALRRAHEKFASAVGEAAGYLSKEVAEIDSLFHEDQEMERAIEADAPIRRGR